MGDKIYYRLELPYPEVIVDAPGPHDIRCIKNDYAGRNSETTAIMQYIYQHYMIAPINKEVADALRSIAIVEMHHHDLLGSAIVELNGDPIIGGMSAFWSGANVNYTKSIKNMLRADIIAEEEAINGYKKTIICLHNDSVKRLIERIILDEEVHIDRLKELLATV